MFTKRMCVSFALIIFSTGVAFSKDYQIAGKWLLFQSISGMNFNSGVEWNFTKDGKLIENADKAPAGMKWEKFDNDIIKMTVDGQDFFIVIEDYITAKDYKPSTGMTFKKKDPSYYTDIKLKTLKGYILFPDDSEYLPLLKIFYATKPGKVKKGFSGYDREDILSAISGSFIATPEPEKILALYAEDVKNKEASEKLAEENEKQRIAGFEKKWGKKVAKAISEQKIFTGMTKEQVKESIGNPPNVDTIEQGNLKVDIWDYDEKLLYFKNNRLDTIKTSTR